MMSKQLSRRAAGVLALAAALVTVVVFRGYGTAAVASPVPLSDARCDAPLSTGRSAVSAQIRYDSGLVLRYCGVQSMFAQLGAQEQPGLVRAVYVFTVDGGWIDARLALYLRRSGGVALAYARAAVVEGDVLSYSQLLRACARGDCGA
jgi:hypothetical protein